MIDLLDSRIWNFVPG